MARVAVRMPGWSFSRLLNRVASRSRSVWEGQLMEVPAVQDSRGMTAVMVTEADPAPAGP